MFQWIITFIFTSFMVVINAEDPTTITEASITSTTHAEELLAPIELGQTLPIVLFEISLSKNIHKLDMPDGIIEAKTVSRRMVKGTKFYKKDSETQIFFCTKEDSHDTCLSPQDFEDLEPLQCSKQPIPVLEEAGGVQCGIGRSGTPHTFIYEICDNTTFYTAKQYMYGKTKIGLFELCYDKEKQKTLYTTHNIESPKLLGSRLLHRERNLDYSFSVEHRLKTANYEAIKNSLQSESDQSVTARSPMYQVQKLVPSEDMAFASGKKTLHQYCNAELQLKVLFPLWNKINEKVRAEAIRMFDDDIKLHVRTGVFNIPTDNSPADGQIYNMWVKMILSTSNDHIQIFQGVAFLMNNFLTSVAIEHSEEELRQTEIEKFCPVNLCEDNFINQFTAVGGRIQCCQITQQIRELFDLSKIDLNPPVLQIPDLIKIQT